MKSCTTSCTELGADVLSRSVSGTHTVVCLGVLPALVLALAVAVVAVKMAAHEHLRLVCFLRQIVPLLDRGHRHLIAEPVAQ